MKPLKYIILFSIFCGIFLIVYRNCDKKGLVRYLFYNDLKLKKLLYFYYEAITHWGYSTGLD